MKPEQMTLNRYTRIGVQLLFWIPTLFFSLLLVRNTIPYFSFSKHFNFIQERLFLFDNALYSFCFYTHIAAGSFCILSALFQFSTAIIRKRTALHVWSGRIYVVVVLLIAAPTGMYMSFFAKGSMWERMLFVFMALLWFYSTARGLDTILKKNIIAHKQWMIRSYAMAMTAVTFRLYHILFYALGWSSLDNYEISLWISVVGNILFAEAIIGLKSKKYFQTFLT
ncbi:MAG: DUF2306 domain-containing protein [Chitinophagaceae bacterium]|nr:DUF2306 domain-containing protein [Chitinophagaceae bacterium]